MHRVAISHGCTTLDVRLHAAFDKNLCGREHGIKIINYGGRALIKTFCLLHEDTSYKDS